ncbi:MAG: T9SS type A sorting domain-containing protein, partial [Balneolaceae bacterium]
SAGSFNWIEMDATLMEEIVHDDVNDYYNYLFCTENRCDDPTQPSSSSIFGTPQNPTPGAYYHVSWMLYFAETYGMEFWKDTWDLVSEQPLIPFTDAIQETLNERGDAFAGAHLQNHLWHLASGQRFTDTNFGFREREFYPNPDIRHNLTTIPDSASGTGLRPLAANYLRAEPMNLTIGHPGIQLRSTAPGTGVGLIGLFNDGSTKVVSGINESGGTYSLQTDWNWNHLSELYLAVVNTNQSQSSDYTVTLQSEVPERDILAQNYPNPFNPATRIEFSISADKHVRLDVYDSVGRRVQTLVNQSLNEGFHTVEFDGSALSSGVYFYRIITDNQTITNKMMLIK